MGSEAKGRAKSAAFAFCIKHGRERKGQAYKMVAVGWPKNKRQQRDGGCPFCKREQA